MRQLNAPSQQCTRSESVENLPVFRNKQHCLALSTSTLLTRFTSKLRNASRLEAAPSLMWRDVFAIHERYWTQTVPWMLPWLEFRVCDLKVTLELPQWLLQLPTWRLTLNVRFRTMTTISLILHFKSTICCAAVFENAWHSCHPQRIVKILWNSTVTLNF